MRQSGALVHRQCVTSFVHCLFVTSCAGTFPSIPASAIDGVSESAVSAACAHIVTTKGIAFPFHRQFTSDDDVAAMLARCVESVYFYKPCHLLSRRVTYSPAM